MEKTFEVEVNLWVTAKDEATAIYEFRKRIQNVEASVFEVKEATQ